MRSIGEALLCLRRIGRGIVVFERNPARHCCVWEESGEAMYLRRIGEALLCLRGIGRGIVVFETKSRLNLVHTFTSSSQSPPSVLMSFC